MRAKLVTIVVPVYADWSSLKDCIDSLIQHVEKMHKIILVNDCGPEADILEEKIQTRIEPYKNFHYFQNSENLGFVRTCNRAVNELDQSDNDILLLNSDTEVTAGFLDEMRGVLYNSARIGTVSPRTNNATICTFPISAIREHGINPRDSFQLFKNSHRKLSRYTVAPTGHGFCLLIRRELIKQYGLFDEAFGKGYGEEVDFCLRIQGKGWQSAISNWSYVYHLEARSFSLDAKAQMIAQSSKIINQRYPKYNQAVRDYIAAALSIEKRILGNSSDTGESNRSRSGREWLKRHHPLIYKKLKSVKKIRRG